MTFYTNAQVTRVHRVGGVLTKRSSEKKEFQSAPIDFTQWKVSLKAVKVDLIWEDIYGYKNEDTRVFRVFWPEYQWNDKELEIWKKKE